MAEFTSNLPDAQPSGQPINPTQGVNYEPVVGLVEGLGKIFSHNAQEKKKQDLLDLQNSVVGEYNRKVSNIDSAVITGQLKPAEGASRSRMLFTEYAASHPQFLSHIKEAASGEHTYGVGSDFFDEEKAQKAQLRQQVQDANKLGIDVKLSDPPELVQAAILHKNQIETFQRTVADRYKYNAETRAQTSEERAARQEADTRFAREGAASLFSTHMPYLHQQAEKISNDSSLTTPEVKLAAWQRIIQPAMSDVVSVTKYDPSAGAPYLTALKDLNSYFEAKVSGKPNAEGLKNQVDSTMSAIKLDKFKDPEVAKAWTFFASFPNMGDKVFARINADTTKKLFSISTEDGPSAIASDPELAKATSNMFSVGTKDLLEGKVTPEKIKQSEVVLDKITNSTLKSLSVSNIYAMDNKALVPIINHLTNPYVAKQVAEGRVNASAGAAAEAVLSTKFKSEAVQEVGKTLAAPFYISKGPGNGEVVLPIRDIVDVNFINGKVIFQKKQGFNENPYGQVNPSQTVYSVIGSLNPSADALTAVIKIGSHLQGSTDYQKHWDDHKHEYFPNVFPDPVKLKVGQIVTAKNGKSYKYLGGDYNDIPNSYLEMPSAGK